MPTVTNSYEQSAKAFSTLNVTGVAASGTNRAFLVFVWGKARVGGGGEDITSVVWDPGGGDEVTLTKLTLHNNGIANMIIFHAQGDGNIAAATNTMTITAADSDFSFNGGGAFVLALNDVDPTTGFNNPATANDVSTLSVTSSSGDLVAGCIVQTLTSGTITPGTGDTEHQDIKQNTAHGVMNSDPSTGASESVDWNGASVTPRIIDAINILQVAAAAGQTHQMML